MQDVWNKLFTMTRGGVSKATRAFHISEDVFGGYNAIFRGAVIKYKEYISVGKARDVGFAQINGFEAKVAGACLHPTSAFCATKYSHDSGQFVEGGDLTDAAGLMLLQPGRAVLMPHQASCVR